MADMDHSKMNAPSGAPEAQWAFVFGDPQQRQHLALGGLSLC
jgi:hypothetical protein